MVDSSSLPNAPIIELGNGVTLQPPLSRCGRGPGLIIVRPSSHAGCQSKNNSLDPAPLTKWAEESYAVVQVTVALDTQEPVCELITAGVNALVSREECEAKDKFALLVYGSQRDYPLQANAFQEIDERIVATICFDAWDLPAKQPTLMHLSVPDDSIESRALLSVYRYPEASSGFIVPGHEHFKTSSAGVAHTRSLGFLKKHLQGPYFDLEKIWEEHAYLEFGERSVEKTMATMVQEPYVNHIPTITGGIGRTRLSSFYLNHFIFNNPQDTELDLISRTIGTDRIVDEFIFCLTHNKEIDWLIPGIPPTGKSLRIPMTAIVNIRGDRLYHEHIAWDQATILVQLGLMPEYLPFPYALPRGKLPSPGKRFEYRVPAAGAETAEKLKDEHSVPSNQMFEYGVREVDA